MGRKQRILYQGQELLLATTDLVFKALLTADGDLELLASLLSCILDLDIAPDDVTVTNSELPQTHEKGKLARVDVRVKLADGKHINVEMQVADDHNIAKRSIFYLSKLYVDQLKPSMNYEEICPAIAINILDFDFLPFEEYHNVYRLKNIKSHHELTDAYEINFIELKKVPTETRTCLKEKWMLFIAADSAEMLDKLANEEPIMEKALKKLQYVSSDDQLRYELDMRQKAELDYGSAMVANYKRGRAEGETTGRLRATTELARKLKASAAMSDDEIAKLCDLPIEEVENL